MQQRFSSATILKAEPLILFLGGVTSNFGFLISLEHSQKKIVQLLRLL